MKIKKSELVKLIQEMVEEAKPKLDIPEDGKIKKGTPLYPGKKGEEAGKFGQGIQKGQKAWRKNKATPKMGKNDLKAKINEMKVLKDQVDMFKSKYKELEAVLKKLEDEVLPVIEGMDKRQAETDKYLLKIGTAGYQSITPAYAAQVEYALSIITEEQRKIMEQIGLDLGGRKTTKARYTVNDLEESSRNYNKSRSQMVEEGFINDVINKIKSVASKVKSWWQSLRKIDKANDILADVADSL